MRNYPKTKCPICGREIRNCNIGKHVKSHDGNPNGSANKYFGKLPVDREKLCCCFCGRVCKTVSGLGRHQVSCHQNPNRIIINQPDCKNRTSWNKGLTKETDERVARGTQKRHQYYLTHDGSFTGRKHSDETKKIMSEIAIKRGIGGHCYKNVIEYNGIKWDSSYEVSVAKNLDENNIPYERPGRFKYVTPDGKEHTYTPDIYLPTFDVYLDPKSDFLIENVNPTTGYKDTYKIQLASEQNGIRIIVLDKNHLYWNAILYLIENG